MSASKFFLLIISLMLTGCAGWHAPEDPPASRPPPAGILRNVNRPEYYFVFESGKPFPAGTELRILRKGRQVGTAKVTALAEKKFQVADILSGAPEVGDLCEPRIPALPVQPQAGQQGEGRRFGP